MKGLTHISTGVIIGTALAAQLQLPITDTAIAVTTSAIASLAPDLDICTSKLGKVVAPLSFTVQVIFGHRSVFHSPFLYAVIFSLLMSIEIIQFTFLVAAIAGVFSHLLLDLLNPMGVPLLFPAIPKRFNLARIRSGGIIDWLLGIVLTVAAIVVVLEYMSNFTAIPIRVSFP